METIVRQKCDNLTGNYVIMSKGNRLEHNELVLAGAGLFQASGITPNPDKLKECKKIIKKREGVFSTFRGLGEYIVRTKMAISDSPEQYLTHLETVYQLLKKFSSDSRTLLAAMVIVDQSQPADYAHMAEKTKYIYQQMRTAHPLLTDQGAFELGFGHGVIHVVPLHGAQLFLRCLLGGGGAGGVDLVRPLEGGGDDPRLTV